MTHAMKRVLIQLCFAALHVEVDETPHFFVLVSKSLVAIRSGLEQLDSVCNKCRLSQNAGWNLS